MDWNSAELQERVGILKIEVLGHTVLLDGDYDGEYLTNHFRFHIAFAAKRSNGYVYVYSRARGGGVRRIHLARMLLAPPPKDLKTPVAGYRDGNTLNLTSTNLYWRTASDAAKEREANYPDKYKKGWGSRKRRRISHPDLAMWHGVYHASNSNGYQAYCSRVYLGHYAHPIDAARAYDDAAYSLWGDKAILNFPEDYGLTTSANSMID